MKHSPDDILAILDQHGARLHALLARLTLRLDVAEDLLQELFCRLVQSREFFLASNQLGYAMRAATNLAFDYRRRQQGVELSPQIVAEAAGDDRSPLVDLIRAEELNQVLNAIATLGQPCRDIIVLHYLERLDYGTIASHLGKTPHQVRAQCYKGITRLRDMFDKRQTERAKTGAPL